MLDNRLNYIRADWGWWMMAVMTAQPSLPAGAGGRASGRCGCGDRRGRWRAGVRARQSGLRLGYRCYRGAPVRGGVADADRGRHPAACRRGVRGDTGHRAPLGDPARRRRCGRAARRRKGPKRKSKLTADTVAAILRLRRDGVSYRGIAAVDRGVAGQRPQRACPCRRRHATSRSLACQPLPLIHSSRAGASPSPGRRPSPSPSRSRSRRSRRGSSRGRWWIRGRIVLQRFPMIRRARQVPVLADPVDRGGRAGVGARSG